MDAPQLGRRKLSLFSLMAILVAFSFFTPDAYAQGVKHMINDPFQRMAKLGLYLPAWFMIPSAPPSPGDGRPTTPLAQTKSSLLLLSVSKEGMPGLCEVLATNDTPGLAERFCEISAMRMKFAPAAKPSQKAFWFHVYSGGEPRLTVVDVPLKK
ncbi:hypothetical protein [Sphingomonas sp. SUN039]|uniref:hypothetical protein n=1 Tax=Sphingomonas sp. SUN039 TaxID=2937787 RepID=UPI0021643323|nr:hypothetical protein [Sphingomonas sp. SUN039]UVO55220.1 hypothetical protein M0209_14190 [Sphingomonas sp. SUN039]